MLRVCGKQVNFARITRRISRARLSTYHMLQRLTAVVRSVKPVALHDFFLLHTHSIPQVKLASSPLIEHYFYPVSTAPTINSIKEKLKKGL